MVNKIGKLLLRSRWLVMVLLGVTVVVVAILKRRPGHPTDRDFTLLREILLFGLVFPLLGGLMLTQLAHQKRNTRTETALNSSPASLPRPRILLIENESILGAGIERLLTDRARLHVIGVTFVNGTILIDTIKQLQPDVIILDEAYLLVIPFNFLIALLDYPSLRVMVISAHHNRVQIYDKQQLEITQLTDLLKVIRNGQNPTP